MEEATKVLLRTWNNKFDWYSVLIVMMGGAIQLALFLVINFCFTISHKANLNIGIAQAIWSVSPFFIALLEWLCYGMRLQVHHIIGMSVMILCVAAVALSNLTTVSTDYNQLLDENSEQVTPIW